MKSLTSAFLSRQDQDEAVRKNFAMALSNTDDIDKDTDFRAQAATKALSVYKDEFKSPSQIVIKTRGKKIEIMNNSALRLASREAVLKSSKAMTRKYSHSQISSQQSSAKSGASTGQQLSHLRQLQQERLLLSRLGFPDKALELDVEIAQVRDVIKSERKLLERKMLKNALKVLDIVQQAKRRELEDKLANELNNLRRNCRQEESELREKQEKDYLAILDNATRRAIGKVKKCNCPQPYLCTHNKTASYNTRKSKKVVLQYRQNAKRLKKGGKLEEAAQWEDKAREIDDQEQENWRKRISVSITASTWGGSGAQVPFTQAIHFSN